MKSPITAFLALLALSATLVACPDQPPAKGSLEITITGNPTGTTPSITVSGPNSFSQTINATTTIPNLEPGSYTLSAAPVVSSNLEYAGAITGSPASVTAGANATASVTYAKSAVLISSLSDAGAGSLRDTISSVNAGETIKFMAGTTGTITLASELEVAKNVTLEGTGVTLSGNNTGRVLNVNAGANVTVKGLVLTAGKASVAAKTRATRAAPAGQGGIIYNAGTLMLKDVEVSSGEAVLGGGVYNATGASLTLESGSIKNNKATSLTSGAGRGGGVYNAQNATFTISGGSVLGNTADYFGGGILNDTGAILTISGGSVENNTATAINAVDGKSYAGGILNNGTFTMSNGLIKGNTAGESGGGVNVNVGSSFTLSGGTIEGNSTTITNSNTGGGVLVNKATFKMSGGTIKGNTAFEGGGLAVYNTVDTVISGGSIEGNTALARGGGVRIFSSATLTMTGGTIQNNTSTGAVDPQNSFGGGVFNGGTFTMNNGTIKGNTVTRGGAGVINDQGATFIMTDGIIEANKTTGTVDNGGGGVLNYLGTFKMSGGTIQGNTSMYAGGVNNWGTFEMTGGTVKNNTAPNGAGGVGNTRAAAVFKLIQGTISGNTGAYGGGIKNTGSFTMTGGTVSGNTATQDGAGIHNSDGGGGITGVTAVIQGGVIENNTATRNGGGIINYKAGITISGGIIKTNSAVQGAGLWTGGDTAILGSASLTGGTISSNTASQSGGGVFRNVNGTFSNTGSTISSNTPNDVFPAP